MGVNQKLRTHALPILRGAELVQNIYGLRACFEPTAEREAEC
jgi:hypothetical protein